MTRRRIPIGARPFCPEAGEYRFSPEVDAVICSIHGDRRHSRQLRADSPTAEFERWFAALRDVRVTIRSGPEALFSAAEFET